MKKCFLKDKHIEMAENIEKCFACGEKIGISFDERINILYKDLITEKMKEDFIKSIKEGKTIGEAGEFINIMGNIFKAYEMTKKLAEFLTAAKCLYGERGEGVKVF